MKAQAENIPTILGQVLSTAQLVTEDPWLRKKVLFDVMETVPELDFDRTPAEVAFDCLRKAYKILGELDPYAELKAQLIENLKQQLPAIEAWINEAKDPLHAALQAAAATNRLTVECSEEDIVSQLPAIMDQKFGVHHYAQLLADIDEATNILYILDNCGECVFDLIVIKHLEAKGKKVTVSVRHEPILQDITQREVELAGIDKHASIIDPGVDMLGVVVSLANRKFQNAFHEADIVISKGLSNCETLMCCKRDVYFLLASTCPFLSKTLKINVGDLVLMKGGKDVIT